MDWQPIENRPPDNLNEAVVAMPWSGDRLRSTIAYWDDEEGHFWNPDSGDRDVQYYTEVVYWMPLPEPPQ
jgi:hypothetical protein